MDEERVGVERVVEALEAGRVLRVKRPRLLDGSHLYYFEFGAYDKTSDFALSTEVLEDLPGMRSYQESVVTFSRGWDKRIRNIIPNAFFTANHIAVEIEFTWPSEPLHQRAASALRAVVRNIQSSRIAKVFVIVTYQQQMFELKEDPFRRFPAMVYAIRRAIDAGTIQFYHPDEHPDELQPVRLLFPTADTLANTNIGDWLQRKVYALAFRVGSSNTQVWVADPWDAEYLSVKVADLKRAADILEAQDILKLDESREFASASRQMLVRAAHFERSEKEATTIGARDCDVFISFAGEQRTFARELSNNLQQLGLSVWLDEMKFTIGDSVSSTIDRGLASSQFGAVILSHDYFAKPWPKRELGALIAKEVDCKVVLPVWYQLSAEQVRAYSPILADKFAVSSDEGVEAVAAKICIAVMKLR